MSLETKSLLLQEKQESLKETSKSRNPTYKCYLPGDVIVHSVSCLLVMDPVANENAGGLLDQLTRAQHAITVPLPIAETAFVHLATGIPR